MSKHTPGPWFVAGVDGGKVSIESKHTPYVALVDYCTSQKANARLIAAAPNLLEALEMLSNCSEYPTPKQNIALAITQAHTAIAKAKGEA